MTEKRDERGKQMGEEEERDDMNMGKVWGWRRSTRGRGVQEEEGKATLDTQRHASFDSLRLMEKAWSLGKCLTLIH